MQLKISAVDLLQASLDSKASTASLAGKAEASHTHPQSDITGLIADLAAKAADADVVKLSGDQTIAGTKTFSTAIAGSVTGNAATATALQTTRTFAISGGGITAAAQNFNGAANVSMSASVDNGHITLARLANLAANSIIGNNTGGAATPVALTAAQATAMLDNFTASLKGLVPASGGGTANYLRADGTWAAPTAGVAWGGITGTLSNQTDLNTALGLKANTADVVLLTGNQTITGVKTFSSPIAGSVTGNAANVTGTVELANGGTGATTASAARANLGLGTAAVRNLHVGTTPPSSPAAGDLWVDTN
jgi:hypothetical protein